MATALYRRYRPDTFQELIGQEQVTGPLMTALDNNRVNHAYLFSGPRGCGKTTSARILARCLNCAKGPAAIPCGECDSCLELATGGPGSLDVIEIDAASHNGVDDARELRERAIFAPTRDRFKIFILDEAHMVTPQGFNALLKLVEEPPEHVKFIFATTEPDKVIGTIRSRTHHYPFRLVPPAVLLPFLENILSSEHLSAEPGVLPLAIRAGGGSVRDTLSVLDQLIAGSETDVLSYERTVMLLGYTSTELLSRCIDALAVLDANLLFHTLEQIMQAGLDPRRFAEDLLGRLRDLVLVRATGDTADAVLQGTPADELGILHEQAQRFGMAQLTRSASIVSDALNAMTGATNPRVQLEIMCAKLLLPAADRAELGMLARLERLERRIDLEIPTGKSSPSTEAPTSVATHRSSSTDQASSSNLVQAAVAPQAIVEPQAAVESQAVVEPLAVVESLPKPEPVSAPKPQPISAPSSEPISAPSVAATSDVEATKSKPEKSKLAKSEPEIVEPANAESPHDKAKNVEQSGSLESTASISPDESDLTSAEDNEPAVEDSEQTESVEAEVPAQAPTEPESVATSEQPVISAQQLRDAWPEILVAVEKASRPAWTLITGAAIQHLEGNILTLAFPSQTTARSFRESKSQHRAPDVLREAIQHVFGIEVKYLARIDTSLARPTPIDAPAPVNTVPPEDTDDVPGWEPLPESEVHSESDDGESSPSGPIDEGPHTARHGEAVLRERLGAVPIDEDRWR